jgi:hypothetical protein
MQSAIHNPQSKTLPHDIHIIRLRGPWQVVPIERYIQHREGRFERTSDRLPTEACATMPSDWADVLGGDFFGRVAYRRTFHGPTGLESGERAMLVVEPPRSHGTIELNGSCLGEVASGAPATRIDITSLLQDRNQLVIVVEHPALDEAQHADEDVVRLLPGGLVGEVRLEIEE